MPKGIHAAPGKQPPWLIPAAAVAGALIAGLLCTWGILWGMQRRARQAATPPETPPAPTAAATVPTQSTQAMTLPPETTLHPTTTTAAVPTTTVKTTKKPTVTAPPIVIEPSNVTGAPTTRTGPTHPKGVSVDMVKNDFQGKGHPIGVDISRHNLGVDWKKLRSAGIDFALIRCGYRTSVSGEIFEDANFRRNIEGAIAAGMPFGVYFYSTAKTVTEARVEAAFVIEVLKGYKEKVTWPVVFDFEAFGQDRLKGVDCTTITDLTVAFLDDIADAGYTPMLYSYRNALWDGFETARLSRYRVWLAQYVNTLDQKRYGGAHAIWQCASDGHVDGVESPRVDLNIAYEDLSRPHAPLLPEVTPERWPSPPADYTFTEVCEQVEVTANGLGLRTSPVTTLPDRYATGKIGQTLLRTGIDEEHGWSRLSVGGLTLYAQTSSLRFLRKTEPPVPPTQPSAPPGPTASGTPSATLPEPSAPPTEPSAPSASTADSDFLRKNRKKD